MCGIAGMWRRSGIDRSDRDRIERMAATLIHRGPDDFGYLLADAAHGLTSVGRVPATDWVPDVLLASRRLAIVDLSTNGRQPIGNEAGDVFVVFNGAIHNYVELRAELETCGHTFRSQTDTEVIVHAYEEWGEDCARRFNGMWAYALWDARQRRLVCSRDRFGIKPLFVAWHGDTFYFASEAKAILAGGEVVATPNLSFVRRYLTFDGYASGCDSAFAGIAQVSSGHNLVITGDGYRETPYWCYTDQSEQYDYERPEETFRELFRDAVRIRLRSDVPVALLLSGGLDSSSIAVHAHPQDETSGMSAYTATFPGFEDDEHRYAALVAAHVGMPLQAVEYSPSRLLDDLAAVTWHMDAPPRRGQELARWQLLQAVSVQARVVLEGQGADEMLAGYAERYVGPYLRAELGRLRPWNLHLGVPRMISAWQLQNRVHSRPLLQALRLRRPPIPRLEPPIAARSLTNQSPSEQGHRATRMPSEQFTDPLTRALYQDHAVGLLPELLHFGDAISMGHSVESRLPFLDHRLVEFLFGLPFDAKMRGAETKRILRRAIGDDLPRAILSRRDKIGFNTPLKRWLQPHSGAIRDLLSSRRTRERGIFDAAGLDYWLSRFEADGVGETRLFRSFALEQWFRRYVD